MSPRVPHNDTIVAPATAPGVGAVAVIRLSGPLAVQIASRVFRGRDLTSVPDRSVTRGGVAAGEERLDEVLAVVMRGPRSFTGEDVVELHCHGGPVTVGRVLAVTVEAGARPAEPGEFTRRAFLNGKLDLAQAEAVGDLVMSRTSAAARAALHQLGGGLSARLAGVGETLADTRARLEAGIDFSDEEDVTIIAGSELRSVLTSALADLGALRDEARAGRRLREGARLVIAGKPNVGKSTLMNALLREDRVIVTPWPGATRDVVEDLIEIAGVPVRLFDTAGLRTASDPAEQAGVERAARAMAAADLTLLVLDRSATLDELDRKAAARVASPAVVVLNKSDLAPVVEDAAAMSLLPGAPLAPLSALHGQGLAQLEGLIAESLTGNASEETPLVTSARHQDALARAVAALRDALASSEGGLSAEFTAADLRRALDALGEITGESASDEVLDRIFEKFCIGK